MALDLDVWLPEPQVRVHQRRATRVDPRRLWHAAETVRLRDTPIFGRAVRWRIPGTSPEVPFRELLRNYPFTVLAEGDQWSPSGLCGRIWTLQVDYPRVDGPDEFRAWSEPGTVRVAIANWIEPDGAGGATIVSEARVKAVDQGASARLRVLWTLVGGLQRFVGGEVLRAVVREAERDRAAPS
jgi:hypothetical protein